MAETRYDDRRSAAILRRAAELQRERSATTGSSLVELEEAAAAVGIDRALVRQAAAELTAPHADGSTGSGWRGGPGRIELRSTLSGPLDDRRVERAVEIIGDVIDEHGHVERVGRDVFWMTGAGNVALQNNNFTARQLHVSFRSRDDGLKVTIEERFSALTGALFGGVLGGLGGGTIVVPLLPALFGGFAWLAPFTVLAWMGGFYALTRSLYRKTLAARRRQLETLREQLKSL